MFTFYMLACYGKKLHDKCGLLIDTNGIFGGVCVRSKKQHERIVCCKFHHSNVYQAFRQINLGHDKNMPKRIAIQKDLVHEISGGLPYTIRVMVELEKALKHQDMQELGIHIVELLLLLKQLDIKKKDLWVLCKEICGNDAGGWWSDQISACLRRRCSRTESASRGNTQCWHWHQIRQRQIPR